MRPRFEPTERTRLRRKPDRGSHERDAVYSILDAGLICHLAYVLEGQPFCTPTAYWREGDRVYWHGSAASRMIQAQAAGIPVCMTVTHIDGLVLGRSGFTHSVLYRSAMVFGRTSLVAASSAKRRLMDAFINRLYPGRPGELRPAHDAEIEAISIVSMEIEEASAKVRGGGVVDREADLAAPCWAGVVPIANTIASIVDDAGLAPGMPRSPSLATYAEGSRLQDVLLPHATRE